MIFKEIQQATLPFLRRGYRLDVLTLRITEDAMMQVCKDVDVHPSYFGQRLDKFMGMRVVIDDSVGKFEVEDSGGNQ